jgi:putative endonuclease
MTWFVYLLECQNSKIYTGITTDVTRRFDEHLSGTGAKFTRVNLPVQILSFKPCMTRSEASSMEMAYQTFKTFTEERISGNLESTRWTVMTIKLRRYISYFWNYKPTVKSWLIRLTHWNYQQTISSTKQINRLTSLWTV